MIILDTNVISEILKPSLDPLVKHWIEQVDVAEICTTAITIAELRHGLLIMSEGRKKQKLLDAFDSLFTDELYGKILSFDDSAAYAYTQILASRRKIGRPMSQSDAQIAAIANSNNATLATRNTVDFEHTGITLINPWNHTP